MERSNTIGALQRRRRVFENVWRSLLAFVGVGLTGGVATGLLTGAVVAGGAMPAMAGPKREGDVLKIFDRGRVYVVTNDDAALADTLLDGCNLRERHVVTLDEWAKIPSDLRRFVSVIYLVNREKVADGVRLPERCVAEANELYTDVIRTVYQSGPTYEVVISAPDAGWLKQGVREFRRWSSVPRTFVKRSVHSIAVVASTPAAALAAQPFILARDNINCPQQAHLLSPERYDVSGPRTADMDEIVLLDRNAAPCAAFAPRMEKWLAGRSIGRGDTIGWREAKSDGRFRTVLCGPTADQLAEVMKADLSRLTENVTVLQTARDLRSVRRVAVVGVKQGPGSDELRRQLATHAATELRQLDAFEVLERAGLSEVLGEVALDQAGITKAKDRAKVRQMAAADALLLVEITDIHGRTDYAAKHKRLTPFMGNAPSRPAEPSRLKINIAISDPNMRVAAESLLKKAIGTKSDEDYDKECRYYQRETLPVWQRQVEQYNYERNNRPVTWEQRVVANSEVTVSGSLRLVDLTDGMVLWERPFTTTDSCDTPMATKSVETVGEDSRPGPADLPQASDVVPEPLLTRAASTALVQGVQSLRGTALLPSGTLSPTPIATLVLGKTDAPLPTVGRLLDVDGDTVLVGLGVGDGVQKGDSLLVSLSDTVQVRVIVTKVRPRTCDALIAASTPMTQQARIAVGQVVTREKTKSP